MTRNPDACAAEENRGEVVQLGFAELERLLAELYSASSAPTAALRARIKQLQRFGLPAKPPSGRGTRLAYSAGDLLQLAAALEIIGNGLSAKAAAEVVLCNWPRFQAAFARAHSRMTYLSDPATYVCIASQRSKTTLAGERVTVHDTTSIASLLASNGPLDSVSWTVLRTDTILSRVISVARRKIQIVDARWAPEFRDWKDDRERDPQTWDFADGEPIGVKRKADDSNS